MSDQRGNYRDDGETQKPMTPAERRAAKIRRAAPPRPGPGWSPAGPFTQPSVPADATVNRPSPAAPPAPAPARATPEAAPPDPQGGPPPPAASAPSPDAGSPAPSAESADDEEARLYDDVLDQEVEEAERAVEADLERLDQLESEKADLLDQLLRTRADFENYRKRIVKQQTEHLERAAEGLVQKLLDVLDTFDAALAHGEGFDQAHSGLMSVLQKEGLEKIDPEGQEFDPNEADAVAHEDGDDGPVVAEVLRPGYRWKGRVVRPAMVKVRG